MTTTTEPAALIGVAWRSGPDVALRRAGGRRADASKYAAVFATCVRNQVAYVGEWALRSVFLTMVLFIFLQLWRTTFASQERQTVAGFSVAQMLWYLAITESIVLSRPRLNQTIDEQVRSGDVAYTLVRPYDYAAYHLMSYLGERLLRFGTTLVISAGLALLYVGPVPLSAPNLLAALVALILAMAIDFLGSFGIALLAFWTEDTSSINLIYDRLVMLLGGMMLPLGAFPAAIGAIARALPFSTLVYGPAALALGAPDAAFPTLIATQIVYLVLAGSAVRALYRAALRRVNANGG